MSMKFTQKVPLPNGGAGRFLPVQRFSVNDPDRVKWLTERFMSEPEFRDQVNEFQASQTKIAEMAGFASFRPTMALPIPGLQLGVVAPQQPFIGKRLMPVFLGGPNEEGYYPKSHKEHLYIDPEGTRVSGDGTVKRLSVRFDFGTAKTYTHAIEVQTTPDEASAADRILGIAIDPYKLDRAQSSLDSEMEKDIADAVLTTSNYAAGYYETLTGTDQWDNKSSEVIQPFYRKRRKLFNATLADPDLFAMGGETEQALMVNEQLIKYSSLAKTGQLKSGAPVTRDFLAAVFQIEIAVGNAAYVSDLSEDVDHTFIWSDFAWLGNTGAQNVFSPRFGLTLGRDGYPSLIAYEDKKPGTKGASVQKYANAWNPVVTMNNAAYLWLDCKSAAA